MRLYKIFLYHPNKTCRAADRVNFVEGTDRQSLIYFGRVWAQGK